MKKLVSIISAICLSSAVHAQTINNLGSATTPLAGTELVPMFQGANPAKQASTQSIANLAVTSIATGCQATGGTITSTGTISTAETVNPQTGANYAILGTDCGKLVNLSNASNQIPTIAQAGTGSFTSGYYVDVVNTGAGTQTITPTTSTINGASSYALLKGQGIRIVSDGTNYQVMPGTGLPPDGSTTAGVGGSLYSIGPHPGFQATWWYTSPVGVAAATGNVLTANNIYCAYWPVLQRATIEAAAAQITTISSGGHLAIGLYANQVTSGQGVGVPGALIDFVSPLSETTGAVVSGALQSNRQLGPGGSAGGRDIWACVSQDNSAAAISSISTSSGGGYIGTSTATGTLWNGMEAGMTCSTCEGAPAWSAGAWTWPNNLNTSTWGPINNTNRVPSIALQILTQP